MGLGSLANAKAQRQTASVSTATRPLRNASGFRQNSPAPAAIGPSIMAGTSITTQESGWSPAIPAWERQSACQSTHARAEAHTLPGFHRAPKITIATKDRYCEITSVDHDEKPSLEVAFLRAFAY